MQHSKEICIPVCSLYLNEGTHCFSKGFSLFFDFCFLFCFVVTVFHYVLVIILFPLLYCRRPLSYTHVRTDHQNQSEISLALSRNKSSAVIKNTEEIKYFIEFRYVQCCLNEVRNCQGICVTE